MRTKEGTSTNRRFVAAHELVTSKSDGESAPPRIVPSDKDLDSELRIQRLSREFGQRIVALVSTAGITVTDAASCAAAVNLRQTIGGIIKEIEAGFADDKTYYWNKHKDVCAAENALLNQLVDPKNLRNPNTIDGKLCRAIQDWTAAEDQRRRDQERELAEKQRREDEATALAEASAATDAGLPEVAEQIIEQAIAAPQRTVVVANVRTEVAGLKTKRYWRWRFTGGPNKQKDILKETPAEIVTRTMKLLPREFCGPAVDTIDRYVGAMKDKAAIPGIQVYYEDVPVR